MLTWLVLRQTAIMRHRAWNVVFEGGDPEMWKPHKEIVRSVYGM